MKYTSEEKKVYFSSQFWNPALGLSLWVSLRGSTLWQEHLEEHILIRVKALLISQARKQTERNELGSQGPLCDLRSSH